MITAGRAARPGEQGGAHTRAASVTATATSTTLPRCWRRTGATTRPTAWAASRTRTGSAGATRTPRPGRRRRSTPSCAAPCAGLLAGPADARAPCELCGRACGLRARVPLRCSVVSAWVQYSSPCPPACPPAYPAACPPELPSSLPSSLPSRLPSRYPPATLQFALKLPSSLPSSCPQLAAGRRTPPHRTGVRASPAG